MKAFRILSVLVLVLAAGGAAAWMAHLPERPPAGSQSASLL